MRKMQIINYLAKKKVQIQIKNTQLLKKKKFKLVNKFTFPNKT